jgi:hypothetical protein
MPPMPICKWRRLRSPLDVLGDQAVDVGDARFGQ